MTTSLYITYKEIAALIEVSPKTVARKKDKWGISKHLAKGFSRPIRFYRKKVIKTLMDSGILDPDP